MYSLLGQGPLTPEEKAEYFNALWSGDPAAWLITIAGIALIAGLVWLTRRRGRREAAGGAAGRDKM